MKKKKNAILKAQIEQYEKLLNEVSKEDEQHLQEEGAEGSQQGIDEASLRHGSIDYDNSPDARGTQRDGNKMKSKK